MGIERERKFLAHQGAWSRSSSVFIRQGYLSRDPERTVRVRLAGGKAQFTVKGMSTGIARAEYEYDIPHVDGCSLLRLCLPAVVEKRRYRVWHDVHEWAVDVFLGRNAGLILAEIELAAEDEAFTRPPWLGREVTGDSRYYNASLSRSPFEQGGLISC